MQGFKTEKAWGKELDRRLARIPKSWWHTPKTRELRGIPDRLGCVNGFFVALELKLDTAGKDDSREALQRHTVKLIADAGSPICVDRLTPNTWPEVERKLLYLSALPPNSSRSANGIFW